MPNELQYSILAHSESVLLEAKWELISKNLNLVTGSKPFDIYKRINRLQKIYIFKNVSETKKLQIAEKIKKVKFQAGDYIIVENRQDEQFYMINEGRVRITQNGKFLRELEEGNCFGEICAINREYRNASVVAITNVICYTLSNEDFEKISENPTVKEYLIKKLSFQDTSIGLKDLFYLKFLGKGKFGSVSLVHNKKNIYAIKAVSRKVADSNRILCKYFVTERNIMLQLDHPFIIKMVKSLKNDYYCFFLLEYINGKNLDEYLNERNNTYNFQQSRFFMGNMLVMIEYLHKRSIAHRDIKPCNIMIDSNGYLKLIDFGTAKKINDFTHTIIGTPHYISPEVITGKGYSLSCDYWSIGICLFEIFYGYHPFGGNARDIYEIYSEIVHR
jgi:cGMP-dependent protein kinase